MLGDYNIHIFNDETNVGRNGRHEMHHLSLTTGAADLEILQGGGG